MSQFPPMKLDKATWWCITTFDEGEQKYLETGPYPEWVSKVYGGMEKCPDTERLHFQGALQCRSQQRFSAIKKLLPKAHIEIAQSADALKRYAMKAETAVGEKKERVNTTPYYTLEMLLKLIAITPTPHAYLLEDWKGRFWARVRMILLQKPYLVGALMKPDVIRAWEHTQDVWITHMTDAETNQLLGEEAIVLQPPQANDADLIMHVQPE